MATPKYAQRIARLPEVFEILGAHPTGLPLEDLAGRLHLPVDELREDLLAFYAADVDPGLFGLTRPAVLEFLGPEGDESDPTTAEVVRIVDERPAEELGVQYVDASELALIYMAARALEDMGPDDPDLDAAIGVLTETLFGDPVTTPAPRARNRALRPLQAAADDHRKVWIVYSRSWRQGVTERMIEPHRLVQTRRGWELDAGPPDEQGRLRTFLLSNIREWRIEEDRFTPPDDLPTLLDRQRSTSPVRVRVPHPARWAADFYAEEVTVVSDDELTATLDLELLPPVEHRVALLLLVAGGDAKVLDPPGLVAAGPRLAAELLSHHRQTGPTVG